MLPILLLVVVDLILLLLRDDSIGSSIIHIVLLLQMLQFLRTVMVVLVLLPLLLQNSSTGNDITLFRFPLFDECFSLLNQSIRENVQCSIVTKQSNSFRITKQSKSFQHDYDRVYIFIVERNRNSLFNHICDEFYKVCRIFIIITFNKTHDCELIHTLPALT